jgi:hypothetical protein
MCGSIKMASSGTASAHSIQLVEIKINNNKALAISTIMINLRVTIDEIEYNMVSWGRHVTKLARVCCE